MERRRREGRVGGGAHGANTEPGSNPPGLLTYLLTRTYFVTTDYAHLGSHPRAQLDAAQARQQRVRRVLDLGLLGPEQLRAANEQRARACAWVLTRGRRRHSCFRGQPGRGERARASSGAWHPLVYFTERHSVLRGTCQGAVAPASMAHWRASITRRPSSIRTSATTSATTSASASPTTSASATLGPAAPPQPPP